MNLARRIAPVAVRMPTGCAPCWRRLRAHPFSLGDLTALRAVVWRKSGPGYRQIAAAAAQPAAAGVMVETVVLTVREDSNNAWSWRKIAKELRDAAR